MFGFTHSQALAVITGYRRKIDLAHDILWALSIRDDISVETRQGLKDARDALEGRRHDELAQEYGVGTFGEYAERVFCETGLPQESER